MLHLRTLDLGNHKGKAFLCQWVKSGRSPYHVFDTALTSDLKLLMLVPYNRLPQEVA
ncbi:hypothetical protein DCAR_0830663 [Daucus carota subsp. sativus]|uniref:Uncharacterized protein n=1 Tax=Daucus carota subsp. sativus TaxID=79200 RepID=A0A175YK05_DAUCS|nr:hypothetical protein DCAR_0830663 [Daucus carota subsp. sativus]